LEIVGPGTATAAHALEFVDPTVYRAVPPQPGSVITQPSRPTPTPTPQETEPWLGPVNLPMSDLVTLDGSALPAPTDGIVHFEAPSLPKHLPRS